MKFSIKDFLSKSDQIRRELMIWSNLLEKCLMENFISCAVLQKELLIINIKLSSEFEFLN